MVGWHHQLNRHDFEQAPGDGQGQGKVACWSPWGCKEVDMTEWVNNNKNICLGSPGGSEGKESARGAGDLDLIPELGRCPGEENDYPLQCSCLENSMDRGGLWATVHGVQRVGHNWVWLTLSLSFTFNMSWPLCWCLLKYFKKSSIASYFAFFFFFFG